LSREWNTLPSKYEMLTFISFDGVQKISSGLVGTTFPGRHFRLSGTTSERVLGWRTLLDKIDISADSVRGGAEQALLLLLLLLLRSVHLLKRREEEMEEESEEE
jgi:hypothetical protein